MFNIYNSMSPVASHRHSKTKRSYECLIFLVLRTPLQVEVSQNSCVHILNPFGGEILKINNIPFSRQIAYRQTSGE